jgi:hypothetical protein
MRCIFCLRPFADPERIETTEHVFPEAMGGRLTIGRVCKSCNDHLGAKIDVTLTDSFPVIAKRGLFRIPGKRGHVPNAFSRLLENPQLVGDSDREIYFKADPVSGWPRLHLKPKLKERLLGETMLIDLSVDERDRDKVPEMLRRAAKRAGKSISDEQIAEAMARSVVSTLQTPLIKSSGSITMPDARLGLLKIVYELAWRWLGDSWLDDPIAAEMRRTLFMPQPVGDMALRGTVGKAEDNQVFTLLRLEPSAHVALTGIVGRSAMIVVRIFDVLAANFVVTDQLDHYATHQQGFFIEVDVKAQISKEWPCLPGMTRHCNWEKIMSPDRAERMRQQMRILYPDSLSRAA